MFTLQPMHSSHTLYEIRLIQIVSKLIEIGFCLLLCLTLQKETSWNRAEGNSAFTRTMQL